MAEWEWGIIASKRVNEVDVRFRRRMFCAMRQHAGRLAHHHYMPALGMTLGDFATWQFVNSIKRTTGYQRRCFVQDTGTKIGPPLRDCSYV